MSQGSFTDAVKSSAQVRVTAVWIDSVPAATVFIAQGQVADEFVMICSPVARSNQALLRIPW